MNKRLKWLKSNIEGCVFYEYPFIVLVKLITRQRITYSAYQPKVA